MISRALHGFPWAIGALFTAALVVAGCGSAAGPGAPTNAPGSTPTGTPAAAGSGDSGGVADTPMNPDRTDICDVAAMSDGQTIAYLTVAGTDTTAAQSECSTLTQGSGWTAVASSPYHQNLYTPVCFVTFDSGRVTARLYTTDTTTFAQGVSVCNPLLHGFGLATLPPS